MLQALNKRDDSLGGNNTWTFSNDVRLVGELTRVVHAVASGVIVEGWATITAYRSRMTDGAIPGMCVIGPVFSTASRGKVLDSDPIFCRLDGINPSVLAGS